jgi:hypothetical protein
LSLDGLYGFDELNAYRLDTKKGKERLRPRQAQNKPRSEIGAGGPVTTLIPRFCLGESTVSKIMIQAYSAL